MSRKGIGSWKGVSHSLVPQPGCVQCDSGVCMGGRYILCPGQPGCGGHSRNRYGVRGELVFYMPSDFTCWGAPGVASVYLGLWGEHTVGMTSTLMFSYGGHCPCKLFGRQWNNLWRGGNETLFNMTLGSRHWFKLLESGTRWFTLVIFKHSIALERNLLMTVNSA